MRHLVKTSFLIILILAVIVGYFLYIVLKAPSAKGNVVDIEIAKGQNLDQIVANLVSSGLLKNPRYFKTLAVLMGRDNLLKAGSYTIPVSTNVYRLIKILSESDGEFKITVTIPEGFTLRKIEERLSKTVERSVEFSKLQIEDFKKEFPVLATVPDSNNLEGYLFPDTYNIDRYDSDFELVQRMLTNLDKKLDSNLLGVIANQGKSLHEIITMASLIEREIPVVQDDERKIVSGVLWKRLRAGMPLQVDATIVYITSKDGRKVLLDDLKVDSPYNTYLYPGLPPGPIASPGLEAIKAAVYPQDSLYWYYLSKPTGETVFSKTLEEHNIARAKYLQ